MSAEGGRRSEGGIAGGKRESLRSKVSRIFRGNSTDETQRSSAPTKATKNKVTAIDPEVCFGTKSFAVASTSGQRGYNEDRYRVITNLERYYAGVLKSDSHLSDAADALARQVLETYVSQGKAPAFNLKSLQQEQFASNTALYGVYDGHGGAKCSSLLALLLPLYLLNSNDFESRLEEAARDACARINDDILQREEADGGSTAITLLIRKRVAYICNVGDCRAVLVSKNKAMALSTDHKASSEAEKKRIEDAGGMVLYIHGVPRVNGHLAVARAFGNPDLKDVVVPEPDLTSHALGDDDEFIVLASDGLWDVLSNDDVASILHDHQWMSIEEVAKLLIEKALKGGSLDNVTVLIVDVRH